MIDWETVRSLAADAAASAEARKRDRRVVRQLSYQHWLDKAGGDLAERGDGDDWPAAPDPRDWMGECAP